MGAEIAGVKIKCEVRMSGEREDLPARSPSRAWLRTY